MYYTVDFKGLGIEGLKISPVAFKAFGIEIMWYGIIIASAMMLCLALASREAKRFKLKADDVTDMFLWVLPLSIVGARLYYVAFSFKEFQGDFLKIINLRTGGLAFYGGVIGGALALWAFALYKKLDWKHLIDFIVVYLPLGQAIGRFGNFFNQEAFGSNTNLPWGMYSENTKAFLESLNPEQFPNIDPLAPVHPTFFYEFLGNMLIFAMLWKVREKANKPLVVFHAYLLSYGVLRFFVEALRTDPLMIAGTSLRISQVLSLLMMLVGSAYLLWAKFKMAPVETISSEEPVVTEEEAE